MNVTIKDIARELGVSYSSVSRALNGKKGVSKRTIETVLEAAERMGYQPNELARGLVNKISNSVGVIIPDINNPYFGELVKGILAAAKENKYNVFLCTTDWNAETEREYYSTLMQKRVDGVIVKPAGIDSTIQCNISSTPIIVIDPIEDSGCHSMVSVDNVQGGYLATKHLLDSGCEDIAFILGKEDRLTCRLRLEGAERALAEKGKSMNPDLIVEGSFSIEGGKEAAEILFSKGGNVDAIFGMNDLIALGILQLCTEQGRRIPEDISVIGYDNISYAGLPQIQLTTVHQPKYELGQLLFETLLEEIQKGKETDKVERKLQPEIIRRKTTKG